MTSQETDNKQEQSEETCWFDRSKNKVCHTIESQNKRLMGPGKHPEDPLVIPEEDTTLHDIGSDKRSKSWVNILKIFIYFVTVLSWIMSILFYFVL